MSLDVSKRYTLMLRIDGGTEPILLTEQLTKFNESGRPSSFEVVRIVDSWNAILAGRIGEVPSVRRTDHE